MTKFKSLSGETHLLIKYVIKLLGLACLRVSNFISKHKFKKDAIKSQSCHHGDNLNQAQLLNCVVWSSFHFGSGFKKNLSTDVDVKTSCLRVKFKCSQTPGCPLWQRHCRAWQYTALCPLPDQTDTMGGSGAPHCPPLSPLRSLVLCHLKNLSS